MQMPSPSIPVSPNEQGPHSIPARSAQQGVSADDFHRFEMPTSSLANMRELAVRPGGLNSDYASPKSATTRTLFFEKRNALIVAAQVNLASRSSVPERVLPVLPSHAEPIDTLSTLLDSVSGIVIGEAHSSIESKRLLIDKMASLKQRGVTTLFLEHLLSDAHQALLDTYLLAPETAIMPEALSAYLEDQDTGHRTDPTGQYTFRRLVETAKQHGIRIKAIDCYASYYLQGLQGNSQGALRTQAMNYYASQVIEYEQSQPGAGKWVALVGNTHSNRFRDVPGLAELTGAIGLRVEETEGSGDPAVRLSIQVDDGEALKENKIGGGNREYIKGDLVLTRRASGGYYLSVIQTQLREPGQFLIRHAPHSADLVLWYRSRQGELLATVIQQEEDGSLYIVATRKDWAMVDRKRYATLGALTADLVAQEGMRRVPAVIFQDSSASDAPTLPPTGGTLPAPETSGESSRLPLVERFARERDVFLLKLSEFATPDEREQFKMGKRNTAALLQNFNLSGTSEPTDLSTYDSAQLMQLYVDSSLPLSTQERGALLQAIHERQTARLIQQAVQWKSEMETRGGRHTQPTVQNLFLAATEQSHGVCSAMAAQIAAVAMDDTHGAGTLHYLRQLSATIENPSLPSNQLFGLGLLEWSLIDDDKKFARSAPRVLARIGDAVTLLQQHAGAPIAYELSVGSHALAVGVVMREGQRTYFLADPNYGYSEFASAAAFQQGLTYVETTLRAREGGASLRLRAYRTDLAQQALFQDHAREGRSNRVRLVDLARPDDLATRFNANMPLDEDPLFRRIEQRLQVAEYRRWVANHGSTLPGSPLTTLVEHILQKHGAAYSAQSADRVFTLRFERGDAIVTWQDSERTTIGTFRIQGWSYPDDVAQLRQCQDFIQRVSARTTFSSFFERFLHRQPTFTVDSVYLAEALPPDNVLPEPHVVAPFEQAAQASTVLAPVRSSTIDALFVQRSLLYQHATRLADDLTRATVALLRDDPKASHRVLLLDLLEAVPDGRWRVAFGDRTDPNAVVYYTTDDSRFTQVKAYLEQHEQRMRPQSDVTGRHVIDAAPTVDGLNSAFAVQALMRLLSKPADGPSSMLAKNLALALQLHDYANLSQVALGMVQDVSHVTQALRTLLSTQEASRMSIGSTGQLLAKGNLALQALSVGFDIYELSQAVTEQQRAVFGTHLGFDSASLGLGLIGLKGSAAGSVVAEGVTGTSGVASTAEFAGAEGIVGGAAELVGDVGLVELAGPAGVIVGGLGIGIGALVKSYSDIANDASAVGRYFYTLNDAYTTHSVTTSGGYRYDATTHSLTPLAPVVVDTLDLRTRQVILSSPKLYRSHPSAFPYAEIRKPQQALDIRERLGIASQAGLPSESQATTRLILPATPQAYIRYSHNLLPGATTRQDGGFSVLRRLEERGDFVFDRYIFPGEYIIQSIHMDFVPTQTKIILDTQIRHVQVPQLPLPLQGYLRYELRAQQGQYVIGLQPGVSLRLKSDEPAHTEWILDARALSSSELTLEAHTLSIGGVSITLAEGGSAGQLLLLKSNGDVARVDLSTQTLRTLDIDARQWAQPTATLEAHLHELATQHQLDQGYVLIEHYTPPVPEGQRAESLPRVYYDAKNARYLYAKGYPDAVLVAVSGNDAYFYHHRTKVNKVLRVEPSRGEVRAAYYTSSENDYLTLWQEGEALLMSVQQHEGDTKQAVYRIEGDALTLIQLCADATLRSELEAQDRLPELTTSLRRYLDRVAQTDFGPTLRPAELPRNGVLVINALQGDLLQQRYWLRVHDRAVIKARLPRTGDAVSVFPSDLTLLSTASLASDSEVMYFYSAQQKRLYRQEMGQEATLVTLPEEAKLRSVEGQLYVSMPDGLLYRMETSGEQTLSAVTHTWLSVQPTWWQAVKTLPSHGTVAILDVKRHDGSALAAWLSGTTLVVASPTLPAVLQFVGLAADGNTAWLYDPVSTQLYAQALLNDNELAQAFTGTTLRAEATLPAALSVTDAFIVGNTLALNPDSHTILPHIRGIDQLVLTPKEPTALAISATDWAHYRTITVDLTQLCAADAQRMAVNVILPDPLALQASQRDGDDWVLLDRSTGRTLTFKHVFAASSTLQADVSVGDGHDLSFKLNPLYHALNAQNDADITSWLGEPVLPLPPHPAPAIAQLVQAMSALTQDNGVSLSMTSSPSAPLATVTLAPST